MKTKLSSAASWFFASLVLVATVSPAQAAEVVQRVREVRLETTTASVHTLEVTGAPHLKTRIRINDTFSAQNVICGVSCSVGAEKDASKTNGYVNWIMESRPQERSLLIWPARLPDARHPPDSFTTNLQVKLDGGHLLNITLRLVKLGHKAQETPAADAVVEVFLPSEATAQIQALAHQKDVEESIGPQKEEAVNERLLSLFRGPLRCQDRFTQASTRKDHTVVRVLQTCASTTAPRMVWATLEITNRGGQELLLEDLILSPQGEWAQQDALKSHASFSMRIPVDQASLASVYVVLPSEVASPPLWELTLVPVAGARRPVTVSRLSF